jgi:hypothetical protein
VRWGRQGERQHRRRSFRFGGRRESVPPLPVPWGVLAIGDGTLHSVIVEQAPARKRRLYKLSLLDTGARCVDDSPAMAVAYLQVPVAKAAAHAVSSRNSAN